MNAAANDHPHRLGTLSDAAEVECADEVEDVELMTTEQRQALNARMAEWWS